jgi:hypothetical protein
MKKLIALLTLMLMTAPAFGGGYQPPIFKAKPLPPTASSKNWLIGLLLCPLVSQGIDTFIVHEVYKRKRNRADELAAFLCLPGQGHLFVALVGDQELAFYSEINRKPPGMP